MTRTRRWILALVLMLWPAPVAWAGACCLPEEAYDAVSARRHEPATQPPSPIGAPQAAESPPPPAPPFANKIDAWNTPLHGANYLAYDGHAAEDLPDAAAYGFDVVRLFLPGVPHEQTDADESFFTSDPYEEALSELDEVIALASANGIRVIVAGGSVPGRMFNWNEHGRGDRRLWRREWLHREFARFWRRIAERYRDQRAVIGYELINEPHFEQSREPERWSHAFFTAFAEEVRGTPGDLNVLYRRAVAAIREVDGDTPVILDSGAWASPMAFAVLDPIPADDRVIYSFHWYGPESFTVWRRHKGANTYPGHETEEERPDGTRGPVTWNIEAHRALMAAPIRAWQARHGIPSNRILCGEFSADRRAPGADAWNRDVVRVLDENGWHWTYYMFRERAWGAKDFELGADPDSTERRRTPMMRTFTEPEGD